MSELYVLEENTSLVKRTLSLPVDIQILWLNVGSKRLTFTKTTVDNVFLTEDLLLLSDAVGLI